jgi:recA bacterial DNA recombination protein
MGMIPIVSPPPPGRDRKIDALLEAFPRGRLSEVVGPRSSGGSGLLLAVLARTTAARRLAAVVDAVDSFDPATAEAAGVDLRFLLWVRCGGRIDAAVRAADLVARCAGFDVVVLDLGPGPLPRLPPAAPVRLQRAAESGTSAVIVRAPQHVAGSGAALVLSITPTRAVWAGRPRSTHLIGLPARVSILHARGQGVHVSAVAGRRIELLAPEWVGAPPLPGSCSKGAVEAPFDDLEREGWQAP